MTSTRSTNDGLWAQRDNFGEGDITILEGYNENIAVLALTLDGLSAGSPYHVYINYIRFGADTNPPAGDRGSVLGSLDGSNFTLFHGPGGTAGTLGFAELTGHVDSDRVGMRGYLSTAVANGSGEILVYASANGNLQERAWFDGASYELVPEPASLALLGIGGLMIARRRK